MFYKAYKVDPVKRPTCLSRNNRNCIFIQKKIDVCQGLYTALIGRDSGLKELEQVKIYQSLDV